MEKECYKIKLERRKKNFRAILTAQNDFVVAPVGAAASHVIDLCAVSKSTHSHAAAAR